MEFRGDGEIMVVMEVPRTSLRAAGDEGLAELEELFWKLDLGPRHRVELLEGQIVVSPKAAYWHERVVTRLGRGFDAVCVANGWEPTPGADLVLSPTRDIIQPDFLIVRDPSAFSTVESVVPIAQVLLVSEICSPSSLRADREVKPLSCAKAGIPFYLLVDRFTQPMTISLMSEPGDQGYRKVQTVHAGPDGGKLHVPEPFAIAIDAATVPAPR
jgi:Uma2 family endonuclease